MSRINNKNKNLTLFLIIFFLASAFVLAFLSYGKTSPEIQQKITQKLPALSTSSIKPIFKPSPTPVPINQESSQISPDGSMTVILKTKEIAPNQLSSQVFVTTEESPSEKLIFDKITDKEAVFEIPFNTWSPDNKYFFIKNKDFLVFKASGKEFGLEPNNKASLDINNYFLAKEIPYNLHDVTGWAAPNLLIVTTTEIGEETEGPSYWFDITSQNFIRLSTRF